MISMSFTDACRRHLQRPRTRWRDRTWGTNRHSIHSRFVRVRLLVPSSIRVPDPNDQQRIWDSSRPQDKAKETGNMDLKWSEQLWNITRQDTTNGTWWTMHKKSNSLDIMHVWAWLMPCAMFLLRLGRTIRRSRHKMPRSLSLRSLHCGR